MTQTQSRPPRLTAEAWAAAREDYAAGTAAAVIAERYGTTERSVRRRAATEGWRRMPLPRAELGAPPPWMAGPRTKAEEIERTPALEEVEDAEAISRFGLVFNPEPQDLRRFAFRQAAENAAMDRPQQAVAWMRLVQLTDRCGARLELDGSAFRDIDYLRAAYLCRLDEAVAEGKADALAAELAREAEAAEAAPLT